VSASGAAPYGPLIAVPLGSAQSVIGVLVTLRTMGAPAFEPAQVPLLTSFADQAALALQLGESNRALRRLDVLAERERIGRELHDTVMQRLFATGLQLQSVVRRIPDPALQELVRPSVDALDQIVRDIRRAVFDLRASGEQERGLDHLPPDTADGAAD
jgi:two-component system, NarL family, sensor histidine kinase DevS